MKFFGVQDMFNLGKDISHHWDNDWTVELNWKDMFVSNSSLIYEVTMGKFVYNKNFVYLI